MSSIKTVLHQFVGHMNALDIEELKDLTEAHSWACAQCSNSDQVKAHNDIGEFFERIIAKSEYLRVNHEVQS